MIEKVTAKKPQSLVTIVGVAAVTALAVAWAANNVKAVRNVTR